MNRIDPAAAAAFFAANRDIKPVRAAYIGRAIPAESNRRPRCCCGAVALLIDAGKCDVDAVTFTVSFIATSLDLELDYVTGFTRGWDDDRKGAMVGSELRPFHDAGHADGAEAYNLTMAALTG